MRVTQGVALGYIGSPFQGLCLASLDSEAGGLRYIEPSFQGC